MSALVLEFARELWTLLAETAPWLLFGFVLAGALKVLVPPERIYRHLGGDDLRSVLLASLYGAPIPLCSCSVIPTATTLRGSGASRGATTSFLISTPETGVDSISVTWALFDPLMTVARPVVALATALVTGGAVNALVRSGRAGPAPGAGATGTDARRAAEARERAGASSSTSTGSEVAGAAAPSGGRATAADSCRAEAPDEPAGDPAAPCSDAKAAESCCAELPAGSAAASGAGSASADPCCAEPTPPRAPSDAACCAAPPERPRWRRALDFAFGALLDDLAPWFLVGFVLSAALIVALPGDALAGVEGWGGMLLALVVGLPLYVCATASTPIAAALVAKGLSPGAALVFLLVGPATNATTLLVVARLLGRRILLAYLAGIAATALAAGLALDALYGALALDLAARVEHTLEHAPGALGHAAGALLALLLLNSLVRRRAWRSLVPSALRGGAARS